LRFHCGKWEEGLRCLSNEKWRPRGFRKRGKQRRTFIRRPCGPLAWGENGCRAELSSVKVRKKEKKTRRTRSESRRVIVQRKRKGERGGGKARPARSSINTKKEREERGRYNPRNANRGRRSWKKTRLRRVRNRTWSQKRN